MCIFVLLYISISNSSLGEFKILLIHYIYITEFVSLRTMFTD